MPLSRNALKIASRWCGETESVHGCQEETTASRWLHYCSRGLCRFHPLHFITASIINKADSENNNSHWEQIICNQVQMMGIMTESALKRWAKQLEGRNIGGNQKGEWVFWRQTISSVGLSRTKPAFKIQGSYSPLVMKERFLVYRWEPDA